MMQALQAFFRAVYYIPVFSFLHRATVMESYRTGTLDKAISLALVGLTFSLTDCGSAPPDLCSEYVDQAEKIVLAEIEQPSLCKLQAMILIIKHRENARRFAGVFMLTAIAARQVTALRLNYEHDASSPIARETFRRTAWSLFMIDTHLAGGYRDFTLMPAEMMHIRLPCGEEAFAVGGIDDTPFLHSSGDHLMSPLALVVKLRSLRHHVLSFTKEAAAVRSSEDGLEAKINGVQASLDAYLTQVPDSYRFSDHAAQLHSYSPTFGYLATINIIWHGTHLILYRLVLAGMKEAIQQRAIDVLDPFALSSYRLRCFDHATALSKVLASLVRTKPQWAILDLDLAVSAYQCLRVLFCLYRIGDPIIDLAELQIHSDVCKAFVHFLFPECEAIRYIVSHVGPAGVSSEMACTNDIGQRRDMDLLISQTFSAPPSPRSPSNDLPVQHDPQQASPAATTTSDSPHVLSRHSAIGQMDEAIRHNKNTGSFPIPLAQSSQGEAMRPSRSTAPTMPASNARTPQPAQSELDESSWAGNDVLSDMLGLHDFMEFGFGPLDQDLTAWRD